MKQLIGKVICHVLTVIDFFVKFIPNGDKYRMYNSGRDMK